MIDVDVLRAPYYLVATRTAVQKAEAVDRMGASGVSLALQQWKAARASWPETALPDATRERLIELSQLPSDWDSYGAVRPSHRAIAQAGTLISRVVAHVGLRGVPHEIMPIADGGIALEWRYPSVELGLNACPEGGWTSLVIRNAEGGQRYEEGYDLSDDDALALIARVVSDAPA